jgi:AcrR family transcriptional regulator
MVSSGATDGDPLACALPSSAPAVSGSQAAIVSAARKLFADHGYQGVSLRAIARAADVDPSLVAYFYGSKEDVFLAAINAVCDTRALIDQVLESREGDLSTRLVGVFLDLWEQPGVCEPLLAVLRSAFNHEPANRVLRQFSVSGFVGPVVASTGVPDAGFRAALVTSQLMGAVFMRYVMGLEPVASTERSVLVAQLASGVDHLLYPDR